MKMSKQERTERLARLRTEIESNSLGVPTLHILRLWNTKTDTRRWIILGTSRHYDDSIGLRDITNNTALALGFRFDRLRGALISHPFVNHGEDIREAVREQLDIPDFDVTEI